MGFRIANSTRGFDRPNVFETLRIRLRELKFSPDDRRQIWFEEFDKFQRTYHYDPSNHDFAVQVNAELDRIDDESRVTPKLPIDLAVAADAAELTNLDPLEIVYHALCEAGYLRPSESSLRQFADSLAGLTPVRFYGPKTALAPLVEALEKAGLTRVSVATFKVLPRGKSVWATVSKSDLRRTLTKIRSESDGCRVQDRMAALLDRLRPKLAAGGGHR